jgi:hypothetical protein
MEREAIDKIRKVCLNGSKSYKRKQQAISNKEQLQAKTEGRDRLSVFTIYNNFLMINTKECGIIDENILF